MWGQQAISCSAVSSSSVPSRNFSHLRKNTECLVWGNAWVCSKVLQRGLSCCPSWPMITIVPFSSCMRKRRMSSCITCMLRNSDTPLYLAMDLIDFQGSLSIMAWIWLTNYGSSFFIRTIKMRLLKLPYLHNLY